MLTKLNNFVIACSFSWWKTGLLILGFSGTISTLMLITAGFPDISGGHEPFDMQNSLSVSDIWAQLATYTEQAFSSYALFQVVDYLFPLLGGLMMAALCAFALRGLSAKAYATASNKKLFLLFLIPTVFDWLENLGLLWVIIAWPEQAQTAAVFAVTAKKCKLATLMLSQPVALLLLVAGLSKRLYTFIRPTKP
jgi:hypothetical protein